MCANLVDIRRVQTEEGLLKGVCSSATVLPTRELNHVSFMIAQIDTRLLHHMTGVLPISLGTF